ncbi:AAA family ATPase [Wolbachia endosymbiont of Madathamugadia hiepei]|nr:AAA family ATPase [Wolbachia endosymbiont of Madathamugadia hiepei]
MLANAAVNYMNVPIIGREKEAAILKNKLHSQSAEFIAVYGRRRVGKTYLIKQFFSKHADILFEQTGLNNGTLQEQLAIFTQVLSNTFYKGARMALPKNWMDALQQLALAIDNNTHENEQVVLFFDELPWLATKKSGFLKALEYFWNTRWTYRKGLILVVCGSAASWMLENIIYTKGGLHNRITARIPLQPFNLRETKEYLRYLGVNLNHQQMLQLYMAMGGIPHYLKEVSKGLSAAQNINVICFQENGLLFDEFDMLFHSLYEEPETYLSIIHAIAKKAKGISRKELIEVTKITEGGYLTTRLRSLEEAGFIGGFLPLSKAKRGVYYRIIDEYVLFYLTWIKPFREVTKRAIISDAHYWELAIKKPVWQTWTGQTFEAVCFKHANKIRRKLNIEHIGVICGDWQYHPEKNSKESGTQVDLVFDREDGCVMLCEIKYSDKPYIVTKEFVEQLKRKETVYREKTKSKKQIFWVLIAANGASENQYLKDTIHHVITLEDLF